jgi:3-hydroxymyristoyl/3-hydroxydecanoyl-(acyl carrier protein) dehydratase
MAKLMSMMDDVKTEEKHKRRRAIKTIDYRDPFLKNTHTAKQHEESLIVD